MSAWWIDEPFLLGSSNPTNGELEGLRAQSFNVLVSLLAEQEQQPAYQPDAAVALGFVRHCIPICDFHAPSLVQCSRFAELMRSLAPGSKVVMHCQGGTGRTGTMAAVYWVAKGMAADEALSLVRARRPGAADEAPGQEAVVREFATQYQPGKYGEG